MCITIKGDKIRKECSRECTRECSMTKMIYKIKI
jgi:hypothetical protein